VERTQALCAAIGRQATVQTLVLSQHDVVRRQLVAYLDRSPGLVVSGEPFTSEAIIRAHPDVLVLDLSRLSQTALREAIDATRVVGARLVALASIREPSDEQTVTEIGGLYRLKSAGADGLAEAVKDIAVQPMRDTVEPPAAP
jgi:DNA-binding NarL/FixJ family response regulator